MLSRLFVILFVLFNVGCASVEVPDFYAYVTLPASQDGFGVKTVSKVSKRIDKEQWDEQKKRGIVVLPEDWAILKKTVRKNCITNKCKQAIGAFDNLFKVIDEALQKADLRK